MTVLTFTNQTVSAHWSRKFVPNRRFGATYSRCKTYRYSLWRSWDGGDGTLLWVMLNPSTADHLGNNDPTIERCEQRAAAWGFARVEIVNLFALRSPRPQALKSALDPVGPRNDRVILDAAERASLILCGWGTWGHLQERAKTVRGLLANRRLHCLGLTQAGEPIHPLYVPYARPHIPMV